MVTEPRSTSSKLGKASGAVEAFRGTPPEARRCIGKRRGNIVAYFRSGV